MFKKRVINKNKLVVASHNLRSNSLRDLANELSKRMGYKVLRVKPERILGRKAVVFSPGIDKIQQFRQFTHNEVACPSYATSLSQAKELPSRLVVVRHLTSASEGRGITIVAKEDLAQVAPLYTEYIPKKKEFRVHILDNKVIDVQEKRRKRGLEQKEYQVRNTHNGYVFCRDNVVEPSDLRTVALSAVTAIQRDKGAVDVIYNEKQDKCFVLEVNQRPGLQGTTLVKYVNAIMENMQ